MSIVGRSCLRVQFWLLVFAVSCSNRTSPSGVDVAGLPEVVPLDLHFGLDQGRPDTPWTDDEASGDLRRPADVNSDLGSSDIAADCGQTCDASVDETEQQGETAGPCELNPECEKNSLDTENCGNCGLRTRQCSEECQYGQWSECVDQGLCALGAREEEECGVAGTRYRDCTESCSWGEWTDCMNQASCQPGDSQTEVCGRCGEHSRGCSSAYQWNDWTVCIKQGLCMVDEVYTQACGNCGTQSKVCDATCQWGVLGECVGQGECGPNDSQTEPCAQCGTSIRSCTDQCAWSDWGECQSQGECAPLDFETLPCGKCGTASRKCTGLCEWGELGTCQGQGECTAGQAASCDNCGFQYCSTSCTWGSCDTGLEDPHEQNDTLATAYDLGAMGDNEMNQVVAANINPSFDTDWYKIAINDTANNAINPRFTLRNVPAGQTYHIYVVYDCLMSNTEYAADMVVTSSGTISLDVSGCYSFIFFDNNSGTAYIKIEPVTTGSCSNYELDIIA